MSEDRALARGDETRHKGITVRAKRMEAEYLARAQSLANATGMPIQVWRSGLDDTTTAGFRIRVGGTYSLVARVVENRWEVATYTRKGTTNCCYSTDYAFENAQNQLLERVIDDAHEALLRRTAALAPVAAFSDPQVTAHLGGVFWQKIQYALNGLFPVPRRRRNTAIEGPPRPRRSLAGVTAALAAGFGRAWPHFRQDVPTNDPLPALGADPAAIRERLQYIRDLSELGREPGKNVGFLSSRRGRNIALQSQLERTVTPRWRQDRVRQHRG